MGDDKIQSEGREENAAQPLNEAKDRGGAERYPSTRQDDGVESRSFDPAAGAPTPRQGAGDGGPESLTGPAGDPAEGKR